MEVGTQVKVVKSPYSSVKKGTVSTITSICYDHFSEGEDMYVLGELPHTLFRLHELTDKV